MLDVASPRKTPLARRVAGSVIAVLAVATAVLFGTGLWNPWRYVVLLQHFHNPFEGAFFVLLLASIAHLLAYPIRSSAGQVWRGRARASLIGATFVFALLAALSRVTTFFTYDATVVARNPAGDRAVAVITIPKSNIPELHVYAGRGLAARDVGNIGIFCGTSEASFIAPNVVHVDSPYGQFNFPLDPATGRPQLHMGASCDAKPVALARLVP